ncbi:hypothetical protein GUITHDRAFT_131684 [Guillardia theta CCMP2712]|uniref:PA14 domain-containing protein n=4 Tax=Guillardia theta TaxID=55529 RepID=L1K3V3_GUITC|nr:hypothetical protein GUITHDRAFT_131684 [Guillardia theta CCMP2712]EKX55501.1 hypothetical protein GUITHDRAFT_131684 [Guillardia theta CCMP2712]|eukprot:XP_005842481.1 hypothetical protein GUITHDRAFT_131684 [Guillardia theta CCMP2712]
MRAGQFHTFAFEFEPSRWSTSLSLSWSPFPGITFPVTLAYNKNALQDCDYSMPCKAIMMEIQPRQIYETSSTVSGIDTVQGIAGLNQFDFSSSTLNFTDNGFVEGYPKYFSRAGYMSIQLQAYDVYGNSIVDGSQAVSLSTLSVLDTGVIQKIQGDLVYLENNISQFQKPSDVRLDIYIRSWRSQNFSSFKIMSFDASNFSAILYPSINGSTLSESNYLFYVVGILYQSNQTVSAWNSVFSWDIYVPTAGLYVLSVKSHRSLEFNGSPFLAAVMSSNFNSSTSQVLSRYFWRVEQLIYFRVVAKDRYGNNLSLSILTNENGLDNSTMNQLSALLYLQTKLDTISRNFILSSGNASFFSLSSNEISNPSHYVGYQITVNGESRNITFQSDSPFSNEYPGVVVTVDVPFTVLPQAGDVYIISKAVFVGKDPKAGCEVFDRYVNVFHGYCHRVETLGTYILEVKYQNSTVGRPITLYVGAGVPCASTSVAAGAGLSLATVGYPAYFMLRSKDRFLNDVLLDGLDYVIQADRAGAFENLTQYTTPTSVNGMLSTNFTPWITGTYQMKIVFGQYLVASSPYIVRVRSGRFCAAASTFYGPGLTLASVGIQSRFVVVAADSFYNFVDSLASISPSCVSDVSNEACSLQMLIGNQTLHFMPTELHLDQYNVFYETYGWNARYEVDIPISIGATSTTFQLNLNQSNFQSQLPGIYATYYADDNFSQPLLTALEYTIDRVNSQSSVCTFGNSSQFPSSIDYQKNFSVRWDGIVYQDPATTYVYAFSLGQQIDRLQLWIDSNLVTDQWYSLGSLYVSNSFFNSKPYPLLSFRLDFRSNSSLFAGISMTRRLSQDSIPTFDSFFYHTTTQFQLIVVGQATAFAAATTASGSSLTLSTAGVSSQITITARDDLYHELIFDSNIQQIVFSAKTGVDSGGLSATYYSDSNLKSPVVTRQRQVVQPLAGYASLTRPLSQPSPASPSTTLNVAYDNLSNEWIHAGDFAVIANEVIEILSISSSTLVVNRNLTGNAQAHPVGTPFNTFPSISLVHVSQYSVRWDGFLKSQNSEVYTIFFTGVGISERVKCWIDDYLLIDAWSSLSGTNLNGTIFFSRAYDYYQIKIEYSNNFSPGGFTLKWSTSTIGIESIPSENFFQSLHWLDSQYPPAHNQYLVPSYNTTVSGSYQTSIASFITGGLYATYYSDVDCTSTALHRVDPAIDFDWGFYNALPSLPQDDFCVRWLGMISPSSSGTYTFEVKALNELKLWIDEGLVLDLYESSSRTRRSFPLYLQSNILYHIRIEYKAYVGLAAVQLSWRSEVIQSFSLQSISYQTCNVNTQTICFNVDGPIGGLGYLAGRLMIRMNGEITQIGTFNVDIYGAVNQIHSNLTGFTFPNKSISFEDILIFYQDVNQTQETSITGMQIINGGSGLIPGRFFIFGTKSVAHGYFITNSSGSLDAFVFKDHGTGFYDFNLNQSSINLYFMDENVSMPGSVTKIQVSGSANVSYSNNGSLVVNCTYPCNGTGLSGNCFASGGNVYFVQILTHGTGYSPTSLPRLECPGGNGQTFEAIVAAQPSILPIVARGARLFPVFRGNAAALVERENLFFKTASISGWDGANVDALRIRANIICGSTSTLTYSGIGWQPKVTRTGFPTSFTIVARDEYGNVFDGNQSSNSFFVAYYYWDNSTIFSKWQGIGILPSSTSGEYTFAISASNQTRAGNFLLETYYAISGGLWATYYMGGDFSLDWKNVALLPVVSRVDSFIDFSTSYGTWPSSPTCIAQFYPMTVRWSGFFNPTLMQCNSSFLSVSLVANSERIRLWLDNQIIVDQWTSLQSLNTNISCYESSYSYVKIDLDYKARYAERGISVRRIVNGSASIVGGSEFYSAYLLQGGNISRRFLTDAVCATATFVYGSGISVATSYSPSQFFIIARDQYHNPAADNVSFFVQVPGAQNVFSRPSSPGIFSVEYLPTLPGLQTVRISLPLQGGLFATYYSDSLFSISLYNRVDTMSYDEYFSTNFFSAPNYLGALNTTFARWGGLLTPWKSSTFNLYVPLVKSDERVRLWVDDRLIIDQWTSLSSVQPLGTLFLDSALFYDVTLEYKGIPGMNGIGLFWSIFEDKTTAVNVSGCLSGCSSSTSSVSLHGEWFESTIVVNGTSSTFLYDGNRSKGRSSVTFSFPLAFGLYSIYVKYPVGSEFDAKVPVQVLFSGKRSQYLINETAGSGLSFLGTFSFDSRGAQVIVSNDYTLSTVAVEEVRISKLADASQYLIASGEVTSALSPRQFIMNLQVEKTSLVGQDLFIKNESRRILDYDVKQNIVTIDQSFSIGLTSLIGEISESDTQLLVQNVSEAGILEYQFIEIDFEIFSVTSVDSSRNELTVMRAQFNTRRQIHLNGSVVRNVLFPGSIANSGEISGVLSCTNLKLSHTASALSGSYSDFILVVDTTSRDNARGILEYSSQREVLLDVPYVATIEPSSRYIVKSRALFWIGGSLVMNGKVSCSQCVVSKEFLYTNPSISKNVTVHVGQQRNLYLSGAHLSISTAGTQGTFQVLVQDLFGGNIQNDIDKVLYANATLITDTYGYGSSSVVDGFLNQVFDSFQLRLDESALPQNGIYVGYNITVGKETRKIREYTSDRNVTVDVPFNLLNFLSPRQRFIISATNFQSTRTWFAGTYCDMSNSTNPCNISYVTTTAGVYLVQVQYFQRGGLNGLYFLNQHLQGKPSMSRVDASESLYVGFASLEHLAPGALAIRWTGLIRPSYSETYTFITNSSVSGPNVFIGGVRVIHGFATSSFKWRSTADVEDDLVQVSFAGTVELQAMTLYEVMIEYWNFNLATVFEMWWKSPSQSLEIIPSSSLYYAYEQAQSSPFALRVFPADFCFNNLSESDPTLRCSIYGSVGSMYGAGISLGTAGVLNTFSLQLRDIYGNVALRDSSSIVALVNSNWRCESSDDLYKYAGLCEPRRAVVASASVSGGLYRYSYLSLTGSFSSEVLAGARVPGGLFATYYTLAPCSDVTTELSMTYSGIAEIVVVSIGSSCLSGGSLSAYGGGGFAFLGTFTVRQGSVDTTRVLNAGLSYWSEPLITCCQMIYAVSISGSGRGYMNGSSALASCDGVTGCSGTGFVGECIVNNGSVVSINILSYGSGYNASALPMIVCPNGTGQVLTPMVDMSEGGGGCQGVAFKAILQTTTQRPNSWWSSDVSSSGARFTFCENLTAQNVRLDSSIDFSGSNSAGVDKITSWPGTPTLSFTGNSFHEELAGQKMVLTWAGPGFSQQVISNNSLAYLAQVEGSPTTMYMLPNAPCASTSSASGYGLTLATAGLVMTFVVTTRDEYKNLHHYLDDNLLGFTFTSYIDAGSQPYLYVLPNSSAGLVAYEYNITTSGVHTLHSFLALSGGLRATYYSDSNLAVPYQTRRDSLIDFSSLTRSNATWPFLTESQFSARWHGFIRAQYKEQYTFYVQLAEAGERVDVSERVRLWINNQLIIDQWSSLALDSAVGIFDFTMSDVLYDIVLEYKSYNASTFLQLLWTSDGQNIPAVCSFSPPSPFPPKYYQPALCSWSLQSTCNDKEICFASSTAINGLSAAGFGTSVAWIGDVNEDGVEDVAVGAPYQESNGLMVGAVYIMLMSLDGSLAAQPYAPSTVIITQGANLGLCLSCLKAGDRFGNCIAAVRDIDRNGLNDIAVGSRNAIFIVLLKKDSSYVCQACNPAVADYVALNISSSLSQDVVPDSLAMMGDLDGNGIADLVYGVGAGDPSSPGNGYIQIVMLSRSCAGGQAICVLSLAKRISYVETVGASASASALFGSSLSPIGDLNGDHVPDIAVGASNEACQPGCAGAVYLLFLDRQGWTVRQWTKICRNSSGLPAEDAASCSSSFGWSVASAGDLNHDGRPDLIVGSNASASTQPANASMIYWLLLTKSGTVLESLVVKGDRFQPETSVNGVSLSTAFDLNRDGMPDFVSGNANQNQSIDSFSVLFSQSLKNWAFNNSNTSVNDSFPSASLFGSYFLYSNGTICQDGSLYANHEGNALTGLYSYIFDGVDSNCRRRCDEDRFCNFYTVGATNSCKTYLSCWKQVVSSDSSTQTFQKNSFLASDNSLLQGRYSNAVLTFSSIQAPYALFSFYYYLYSDSSASIDVRVRSVSTVQTTGSLTSVVNNSYFSLDSNSPPYNDWWTGMFVVIGGETRRIRRYYHNRYVLTEVSFSFDLAVGSPFQIFKSSSICFSQSCSSSFDWSTVWSSEAARSLPVTWQFVSLNLEAHIQPVEIQVQVSFSTSNSFRVGLDGLQTTLFNNPYRSSINRPRLVKKQLVPSARLYVPFETVSSPFTLNVRPSSTSPQTSVCQGCSVTYLSASSLHKFYITLKDSFGNVRSAVNASENGTFFSRPAPMFALHHEDGLVIFLESLLNLNEVKRSSVIFTSGAEYTAQIQPSELNETNNGYTFQSSEFRLYFARVGGLRGDYFKREELISPVFTRIDETIDFSFTTSFPGSPQFMPIDFFSARWKGWVRPPFSETFTFKTETLASKSVGGMEGVRLWLSGEHIGILNLIIDRWGGREPEYTGTLSLQTDVLYDIVLEYRDTYSSSKIRILWKSASMGDTFNVIPSDRLYYTIGTNSTDAASITVGP